jgi:hypothetical protein
VPKVICVARFHAHLTRGRARARWLCVQDGHTPGLHRYVQSHVVGPLPPSTAWPCFDGYACAWYGEDAPVDAAPTAPLAWGVSGSFHEHVIVAPTGSGVKLAAIARVDPSRRERWLSDAGGALAEVAGVEGLVLNVAADPVGAGSPFGLAAVAEVWFADRTELVRALVTPEWLTAHEAMAVPPDRWAVLVEWLLKEE